MNLTTASLKFPPLHLVWAGPLMVHLFFMLSGVVLVRGLPALDSAHQGARWIMKRLVRLYGPIWAAVLLTWALSQALPRGGNWLSTWANEYSRQYSVETFLQDLFLIRGSSGMNPPLWSLQFEILFSIALPVIHFLFSKLGRKFKINSVLVFIGVPAVTLLPYSEYAAMFLVGYWIAENWRYCHYVYELIQHRVLAALNGKLLHLKRIFAWSVLIFLIDCSAVSWGAWSLIPANLQVLMQIVGLAVLLIASVRAQALVRFLTLPGVQWLGRMSFSLYLVHLPVILAVVSIVDDFRVSIPASVVAVFVLTTVFERYVERPMHRFAKRI